MGKVDIAGTIRTLATLVRLHEGNLDAEVNALLERADACALSAEALIEAAGLRVDWTNGTWYVLIADGTAYSNIGHATESAARQEAAEALASALAALEPQA